MHARAHDDALARLERLRVAREARDREQGADFQCVSDFCALPTRLEVGRKLRHAPVLKGVGGDRIGGELLRIAPAEVNRVMHPVMINSSVRVAPPTQWRGGQLKELSGQCYY